MPRPRKDQEGPSAVERMEEAFWSALAEKPYAKMTVGDIAQRAQVNKNAFYYHYSSLYALAERAIDNTLPRELARMILLGGGLSGIQLDALAATAPNLEQRTERIRLLAGPHGSSELAALLKQRILHAWLDIFGIGEANLDRESSVTLSFTLGGMLEVLGNDRCFEGRASLPQLLFSSPLMSSTAAAGLDVLHGAAEGATKR